MSARSSMPARNSTIRSACRDATVAVRPAVFLDRDGTIIEDVGNLHALEQIAFFPWSADAIRCLNSAGLPVVVITNQAGVARGLFTEQFVGETHARLSERLAEGGAHVDAYYYCPHHPGGTVAAHAKACDCRKPAGGLVDRAARDLGLDPARSFVVGDKWLDGRARAVGLVGADPDGRRLLTSLHRGVERNHIVRARGYLTPVKTRILAGGIHAARQQVVRIDRDSAWPLDESIGRALAAKI